MAWRCTGRNNDEMVDKFVHMGIITSKEVEDAFRLIPRGAFVPTEIQDEAYVDAPIRGDPHVHMSAPHMYATILEALDLQPGFSFLNIGSGTGYFSSLAGYVLKRGAVNHGIEVYEDLTEYANERLEEFLRYSPQVGREFCHPKFICGNCFRLDQSDRKYDRVYSGAACPTSKISFILQLTKVGGFAIVPSRNKLLKLERLSGSQVRQTAISDVCFASLVLPSERETSLPKLKFPETEQKLKQKQIRVLPPSDVIISRSKARKVLAKLRAVQEAIECLRRGCGIPLPFCYVPSQNQIQSLIKKEKPKQRRRSSIKITSPVDSKISFFSISGTQSSPERNSLEESNYLQGDHNGVPSRVPYSLDQTESDMWDYLASETLWQTVLEHYYSMCNVSDERKKKSLKVYIKKSKQQMVEPKKYPSFAEIAMKMGLIPFPIASTPSHFNEKNDHDKSLKGVENAVVFQKESDSRATNSTSTTNEICSNCNNCFGKRVETENGSSSASTQVVASVKEPQTEPNNERTAFVKTTDTLSKQETVESPCLTSEGYCLASKTLTGKSCAANTSEGICVTSKTLTGDPSVMQTSESDRLSNDFHTGESCVAKTSEDHSLTSKTVMGDPCVTQTIESDRLTSNFRTGEFCATKTSEDDSLACKTPTGDPCVTQTSESEHLTSNFQTGESGATKTSGDSLTSKTPTGDFCVTQTSGSEHLTSNFQTGESGATKTSGDSLTSKTPTGDSCVTQTSGSDCLTSNTQTTGSCESVSSKLGKDDDRLLITTDQELVDKLVAVPPGDWKLEEDYELAQFLSSITQKSNKGRCRGWFRSELIRPEIFAKEDIMCYPRIASYAPERLAFRTTVLCRIAKVLDSVLYLLSGPSLLKELDFISGSNTLDSFSESSFISSRSIWGSDLPESSKSSQSEKRIEKEKLPVFEKEEVAVDCSKELEYVRCEQQLILKKMKLTQALQDQYKEQHKLLKRQIRLVEEQQQLLQNIHLQEYMREEQRKEGVSDLQLDVTELKGQRLELFTKQQHLTEQQGEQDRVKNDLLTRLKKLKEDEQRLLQNWRRKKHRNVTSSGGGCGQGGAISTGISGSEEKKLSKRELSTVNQPVSLRFHLSHLLPQVRFLLPLCQQRWRIVHGLLHASELSSPDHMPVITVDRRTPQSSRNIHNNSVVMQIYKELRVEGLHFRWNKRKYDQWWEVKFVGEGIIDQGGGFRDSLAEIADELCPSGDGEEVLPFFIKTPNNRDRVGDHFDGYIPNPSCDNIPVLTWIGKLMGGMFRSDESLTLTFPPFVWKLLVGEHVTWSHDYVSVDEAAVKITDDLEFMDEDLYNQTYGSLCTFSTVLSNGLREELVPNGETKQVKPEEREKFASLVRHKRMAECTKQVLAIRKGLVSVIPDSVLHLLTWRELERAVCGDPDISVSVLKSACQYGDDLSESSLCVQYMWTAITQFSVEERSRFLRFVTGRKRPPAPFTVSKASGELNCLPNASTCASTLFLPIYSTATIAAEKLRYAIHNCVAIDTDTSPW